jgi:two-component system, OmpR family, KDP operon response regulator KdpE
MDSPPTRVVVVDDETSIRSIVRAAVESLGHEVLEAATATHALELVRRERPQLVILDLGLRDGSGFDVCRDLRSWSAVPILVLTARHEDAEKVRLLDAGADDYLTKPFSTVELQARVRAQLRRAAMGPVPGGDQPFERDGLAIDLARRTVRRGSDEIHLTPTEWSLLRELLGHAGRTLTHHQLFSEVWGRSHGDAQQYLRVYIAHLRRKLERDPLRPSLIVTEAGVGYRFVAE